MNQPKKILAIRTGDSTQDFVKKNISLRSDITTFALHRAVPFILKNSNHKVDYWTWFDPDAAIDGLKYWNETKDVNFPTVIIPNWLLKAKNAKPNMGGSGFYKNSNHIKLYESTLSELQHIGKVIILKNVLSKYNSQPPLSHSDRFLDKIYFGTSSPLTESKLTLNVLPICHYLKATEVYLIGFDNRGTSIGSNSKFHNPKTEPHLKHLKNWVNWEEFHGMKIYGCAESKFTPNSQIIPYKPIEELT